MRSEGCKSIRCVSKATPARPYACRAEQCEAMEKAFRWPVAPRQSEPCLYGRLLFVQSACTCLQFRLAMLLHFFQPPPQPISLALTQHMTKGLHIYGQRLIDESEGGHSVD